MSEILLGTEITFVVVVNANPNFDRLPFTWSALHKYYWINEWERNYPKSVNSCPWIAKVLEALKELLCIKFQRGTIPFSHSFSEFQASTFSLVRLKHFTYRCHGGLSAIIFPEFLILSYFKVLIKDACKILWCSGTGWNLRSHIL